MSTLAIAALVLGLPLRAAAPVPTPIVGGEKVPLDEWTGVVALLSQQSNTTANLCSGTVIAPRVILTAAHCVVDGPKVEEMAVYFGDTIYTTNPGRVAAVERYGLYPTACTENCKPDAYDFAYVIVEPDLVGIEIIPPIVTQDEWDETMRVGTEIHVIGFGTTSDDSDSTPAPGNSVGFKRIMSTPIDSFSASGREFRAGGEGQDACGGDSGGPAFVRLASGEWRLAGVTSRGVRPCGTGDSVYGVPYPVLTWLRDETGVDLLPADCEDGDCLVTRQPEHGCAVTRDGAGLALLAPLLALARRRRRAG